MAATPSITKADVEAAIRDLQARRVNPSVRLIRRALGNRGSNEVILRLRAEILGLPDRADDAAPPANLLLRIQDVAPDLWKSAVQDARAAVATEITRLNDQLQLAQTQAGEAAQLLEERQAQLAQESQERERLATRLAELHAATQVLGDRQGAVEAGLGRQADGVADLRAVITGQGAAFQSLFLEADERWRREAAVAADRSATERARIAELQVGLDEARNQVLAQKAATAAAEARAKQAEDLLGQAHEERQAAGRDLEEARKEGRNLAETLAGAAARIEDLSARQVALVEQVAQLRRELAQAQATGAALAAERDAAVAERADMEERLVQGMTDGTGSILEQLGRLQEALADIGTRLPASGRA
jgi:predicted  nucleic acid-binding Zn-ribbon protein